MNATEAGLLHAIASEPDDDTPRLVYSDWLDDHGQPERAEFIRAQIDLANDPTDSPQRRERASRARHLLDRYERLWLGNLHGWALETTWQRGFPEGLLIPAEELASLAAADLFARLPLRHLAVIDLVGDAGPLAMLPPENRLASLDLTGNDLGRGALEYLARFQHLPHLERLSLQFNRLNDECLTPLCEAAFFERLTLWLGANPFSEEVGRPALQRHFGDRVSFACRRHEDHLYVFDDPTFLTGRLPDQRQLFLMWGEDTMRIAFFDDEGNLLGIEKRTFFADDRAGRSQEDAAWLAELGCVEQPIRVKHFRLNAHEGINDFNWWAEAFDRADHEGNDLTSMVRHWVLDGQFEWDYGNDNVWLDRTGAVTDT